MRRSAIIGKSKATLPASKLAIITNIYCPVTGVPYNITVQCQDVNGTPVLAGQDYPAAIVLQTGLGTVSGSGTILSGTSQITISVTHTQQSGYIGAQWRANSSLLTSGISNTFNLVPPVASIISVTPGRYNVSLVWSNSGNILIFGQLGTSITIDESLLASTNPSSITTNAVFTSAPTFSGTAKTLFKGGGTTQNITGFTRGQTVTFAFYTYTGDATNSYNLAEITTTISTT